MVLPLCRRRTQKYDLLTDPHAVKFLLELAKSEQLTGWVIACVNDETIEFLSRNHAALSEVFVLPVPVWDVTKNFYEKDLAYALAQSASIPFQRCIVLTR